MRAKVFIATSLDGYIAGKDGDLEWLHSVPNPNQIDMGFAAFMNSVDALLMGRNTFETVVGFGVEWPYTKPVYVLSQTLQSVPEELQDKVFLVSGKLSEVMGELSQAGHQTLYVDGGRLIQSMLAEDRIDEMIITTIPVLLGGGVPLFGELGMPLHFQAVKVERFLDRIVQTTYRRDR